MRAFVTGDIHGRIEATRLGPSTFPQGKRLTKQDYLIIAGDFGLPWSFTAEEMHWLDWLDQRPWTTLFVDGNHENHATLAGLPVESWMGGRVHRVTDSVLHLMRGQVYDLDGTTLFTMGGATSVDRFQRTEGVSWWPEELPSQAEYEEATRNLDAVGWKVDYVVTHCCASSIIPYIYPDGEVWQGPDALTDWLDTIEHRLMYKQWYFGHHHQDLVIEPDHRLIYSDIVRLGELDDIDMSNPLMRR